MILKFIIDKFYCAPQAKAPKQQRQRNSNSGKMKELAFTFQVWRKTILLLLLFLLLQACKRAVKQSIFSKEPLGYWWQLLSYGDQVQKYRKSDIAWINATFATQDDSVFYDSSHDLRDRFFMAIDSSQKNNFLKHVISKATIGDSLCILIEPSQFFKQQFGKDAPYFCIDDSIVKINLKIKDILSPFEFKNLALEIANSEMAEIEQYYQSATQFELARDPLGFYWIEKPVDVEGRRVKSGDLIEVSYRGAFLDGRTIDFSPPHSQVVYGTPDQLLRGINYVISRLKLGQNSKIILPSPLAFGENGSSNGSIPPFTPLLYQVSIKEVIN
jgi:FKBP-type peptidyl-prolyl cis-trans isomerase FkpA